MPAVTVEVSQSMCSQLDRLIDVPFESILDILVVAAGCDCAATIRSTVTGHGVTVSILSVSTVDLPIDASNHDCKVIMLNEPRSICP